MVTIFHFNSRHCSFSIFRTRNKQNCSLEISLFNVQTIYFLSLLFWFFFMMLIYGVLNFLKIQTELISAVLLVIFGSCLFTLAPMISFKGVVPLLVVWLLSVIAFYMNIYLSLKPLSPNYKLLDS